MCRGAQVESADRRGDVTSSGRQGQLAPANRPAGSPAPSPRWICALGVRFEDREDDFLLARSGNAFELHGVGHFQEFFNGFPLQFG
jgi:hypothetical protein